MPPTSWTRVGYTALAHEYLARAKRSRRTPPTWSPWWTRWWRRGTVTPRSPSNGCWRFGLTTASTRVEQWRVTSMRAFAAFRRGQDDVAAGWPPKRAKRPLAWANPCSRSCAKAVAEQYRFGGKTEQPAAVALRASALPMSLAVLGRFEADRGRPPGPLRPGQETQLLKFVTVSGGRVHSRTGH